MFNLAYFFRSEPIPSHENKTNPSENAWPSPDVIRDPAQIAKQLKDQVQQAHQGLLLALIEGEPQAVSIKDLNLNLETQQLEIEFRELRAELVHKSLTLIDNWHEYRIAFSCKVLTQLSRQRFTLAWPTEIIHTTGREYFRLHPTHKVAVIISTAAHKLTCSLYDLSEGGIGLTIAASDLAFFQALSGTEVLIELAGQRLVSQLHLCSYHTAASTASNPSTSSHIGLAFTQIASEEQAKIRKLILQLQSRHSAQ